MEANASFEKEEVVNYAHAYEGKRIFLSKEKLLRKEKGFHLHFLAHGFVNSRNGQMNNALSAQKDQ